MTNLFDESSIELTCPHCGHQFSERLGKLKAEPQLTCGSCSGAITIDASGLNATLKEVDQAQAELARTLRRFGQ